MRRFDIESIRGHKDLVQVFSASGKLVLAEDAFSEIAKLKEEVSKLREDKAATIRKAWQASQDWEWDSFSKLSLTDYIKQELGNAAVSNEGAE